MRLVFFLFVVTTLAVSARGASAAADLQEVVSGAIARMVTDRMGDGTRVRLERLDLRMSNAGAVVGAGPLRAVSPPGARTGQAVPFAIFAGSTRVGTATALVRATVAHVRAAGPVARDATIAASDAAGMTGDVDGVHFERLPRLAELVGARVRRDMRAGEPFTHATVLVASAVQSGDEVQVIVRVGTVEAHGVGRASGSGHVGEWVRVARPGQPGWLSARVVAPGVVELQPGQRGPGSARRR